MSEFLSTLEAFGGGSLAILAAVLVWWSKGWIEWRSAVRQRAEDIERQRLLDESLRERERAIDLVERVRAIDRTAEEAQRRSACDHEWLDVTTFGREFEALCTHCSATTTDRSDVRPAARRRAPEPPAPLPIVAPVARAVELP